MPHKTIIRLSGVARNPANGFPARLLGSTALFGGVDTALVMRRKNAGRTLESIQRYGQGLPETVITLDQETGIVSEAGTVFDVEISRAKEGIKAAIKDGSMTREMIIDAVEGATKTIVVALKQLVEDKELIKYGGGKKNDPFMYSLSQPYPSQEQIPDQEENGCFPVLSIYPEQETGKTIIMLYLRETLRYQSRKGYSRKYV